MTDQPDMIAQAGSLLAMLQNGNPIAVHIDGDDGAYIDGQIVQASAILAVAAELRDIRNQLADIAAALTPTQEAPNGQ